MKVFVARFSVCRSRHIRSAHGHNLSRRRSTGGFPAGHRTLRFWRSITTSVVSILSPLWACSLKVSIQYCTSANRPAVPLNSYCRSCSLSIYLAVGSDFNLIVHLVHRTLLLGFAEGEDGSCMVMIFCSYKLDR